MTNFSAEVFQNEFLPAGGTDVDAIVTVTGSGGNAASTPQRAVEIIIIDISGSMGARHKLESAKRATGAAIGAIRDGVEFALIAGNANGTQVYPRRGLALASPDSRAEATNAVSQLRAQGGTAMGAWLRVANELFASAPDTIRHAILLTDGKDEGESRETLQRILQMCAGNFQCDCRGVGTDWEVGELKEIASALLGTIDIIPAPEAMPAEFQALMERAMGKTTHDVALDVWTPQHATVSSFMQVAPTIEDLTDLATPVDARNLRYPTGAWGNESRDYHLRVVVPAQPAGEELRAARVRVIVDGEIAAEIPVRAVWTDDPVLSTRIDRAVAHYTGQAELAQSIQVGLEACNAGDRDTATAQLGRAYRIAKASGHDSTLALLDKVVEIENADTGTVRLRANIELVDHKTLETRSTKTARVRRAEMT